MPAYISIIIRSAAVYFVLLIITRLMGKREVSQLTFFDYTVGITIGSMAGIMAVDTTIAWIDILPGVLILGALQIITALISLKSIAFRKLINGTPTILIENGRIIEENLVKEKLTKSTFVSMLREKNAFKLGDVEFALMESDGRISVMLKPDKQPVTPRDLKMPSQYSGLPEIVIEDGNILGKNLKSMGYTVSWLMGKLSEKGIFDISNVSLAQADSTGDLYIDLYEQHEYKEQNNTSGQMLLAKLEKLHSDFMAYSLETQNADAKSFYKECSESINNIMSQFDNYIKRKDQ